MCVASPHRGGDSECPLSKNVYSSFRINIIIVLRDNKILNIQENNAYVEIYVKSSLQVKLISYIALEFPAK